MQHFQDGLFLMDVPTFGEDAVREAILNAVCHRDYRNQGSVFVRQFPRRIVIDSPGGLPEGITTDNLLYRQMPRNRTIADALCKAGLVERAGQGFDKIFRACCSESKPLPDFAGTDEHWVILTLQGTIQDPAFLRYLEQVGEETQRLFTVDDFLVLHHVRQGHAIPEQLRPRLTHLTDCGALERTGRGRGVRYILAKRFYAMTGKRGEYTTRRGLARETNKELLIRHLEHFGNGSLEEFRQILPTLSRFQIYGLLRELKDEGKIRLKGQTRSSPGIRQGGRRGLDLRSRHAGRE